MNKYIISRIDIVFVFCAILCLCLVNIDPITILVELSSYYRYFTVLTGFYPFPRAGSLFLKFQPIKALKRNGPVRNFVWYFKLVTFRANLKQPSCKHPVLLVNILTSTDPTSSPHKLTPHTPTLHPITPPCYNTDNSTTIHTPLLLYSTTPILHYTGQNNYYPQNVNQSFDTKRLFSETS